MTTWLQVKNNASSSLVATITAIASSLTVKTGEGARFPAAFPFHISIDNEIMEVTARTGDVMTVTRAQEGTTGAIHASNTAVRLNITAAIVKQVQDVIDGLGGADISTLLSGALPENVAIILDAALSADGKYNGICRAGVAGATLAFGDLVYYAVADGRWELADADQESTCKGMLGICVLAAAGDGDATLILLMGIVMAATFPAFTAGAPVFVGTTNGDVQVAAPSGAGDVIRCVGQAWTADELWFNPSPDWFEHV
jgi:hypothetical protein